MERLRGSHRLDPAELALDDGRDVWIQGCAAASGPVSRNRADGAMAFSMKSRQSELASPGIETTRGKSCPLTT